MYELRAPTDIKRNVAIGDSCCSDRRAEKDFKTSAAARCPETQHLNKCSTKHRRRDETAQSRLLYSDTVRQECKATDVDVKEKNDGAEVFGLSGGGIVREPAALLNHTSGCSL
ncbi:unnamed protein product [Heligmosomoides polygyrus]|uniref:Uncharacterized protein n=1 Tax=Heligmosomoides polygyrus TaxID=6339 RepID=A0A183G570_HELPZ|nr:unnamed protein product [Heligmosomoides polygyrus]